MNHKGQEHKIGIIMLFAAWGLFLGILTYFFHNWYSARENPNQTVQSLVLSDGSHQVILKRNYQNQYIATGTINGKKVMFLLDTGATHVVLPQEVAEKIGLIQGVPQMASTAGGRARIYATNIDTIKIGNIQLQGVKASISEKMDGDYVLLGMSALKHFNLTQKNSLLIITLPLNTAR